MKCGFRNGGAAEPVTNFTSDKPSSFYAGLYQKDGLEGGHVIMLGGDADSRCSFIDAQTNIMHSNLSRLPHNEYQGLCNLQNQIAS